MFSKYRKSLAVFFVLAFLLTSIASVSAQLTDVSDHWANKSGTIDKWVSQGLMGGYDDNTFKPDKTISRAEFFALITHVFNYIDKADTVFTDLDKNSEYGEVVAKCVAAGIIKDGYGDGTVRPDRSISRQEAMVLIAGAFDMKAADKTAYKDFSDYRKIGSWSSDAVSALLEKGYISLDGRGGKKFEPEANLTRAEAVILINNLMGELKSKAGTYTGEIKGNLVVSTKDVILKDMTIAGDLFLTQGIGNGDVSLDNVTVKGRTIVKGGGENSIHLTNTKLTGTLVIIKQDGKIRIVASGSTEVASVELGSGAKLQEETGSTGKGFGNVEVITVEAGQSITLDGDFDEVSMEAAGAELKVVDGSVGKLTVSETATDSKVDVAKEATVTKFAAYTDINVSGQGTIKEAEVLKTSDIKFEKEPEKTTVVTVIPTPVPTATPTPSATPTPTATATPTPTPTTAPAGGGGGGDTSTPTPASASAITLTTTAGNQAATISGSSATLNLGGFSNTATISNISINTVGAASLTISTVNGITINKLCPASANNISVSVASLLGTNGSVYLSTLRDIFGNNGTITLVGTLNAASGYSNTSVTLTISLGSGAGMSNDYYDFAISGNTTFNAYLKPGAVIGSTSLDSIGVVSLILNSVGTVPSSVTIGANSKITIANPLIPTSSEISTIGANVLNSVNTLRAAKIPAQSALTSFSQIQLQDLNGLTIGFTKTGDSTPYTLNISQPTAALASTITLTTSATSPSITVSGSSATLDLTGISSTATISNISIATVYAKSLTISTINGISYDKTFNASSNTITISVASLFGSDGSVYLSTLRDIFSGSSGTIILTGVLDAVAGYNNTPVTLTIQLGTSGENSNNYYNFSINGTTVTATIKSGQGGTYLSSIGVIDLIAASARAIMDNTEVAFDTVKIGTTNTITIANPYAPTSNDKSNIASAIVSAVNAASNKGYTSISQVKLQDLNGLTILFTKDGDPTTYSLIITQ